MSESVDARSARSGSRVPNVMQGCLVAALLGLFALQALLTSQQMSPAYDEVAKLPAGYVLLRTGQWRLMAEHPPLFYGLSALPLLALDLRLDVADPNLANPPSYRYRWNVGLNFLRANNVDDEIFFWGRLVTLLLALLLGYFVYRWSQALYGTSAGLMALLLYAFSPTMIAFSSLASDDVGLSAFVTLSLYWLWRFMKEGTWHNLLWTGLLLGCALATKTSAIVLLPVFVGLVLLSTWRVPGSERGDPVGAAPVAGVAFPLAAELVRERLRHSLIALALIVFLASGVLYTAYIFPDDPLAYVRSILVTPNMVPPTYPYYLMGQFRTEGWWYYFLAAFVMKTPLPTLALIPLAFWNWARRGAGWVHEVFLLLPIVAFVILISALAPPIGVRFLLPVYPLLFIFCSGTAPLFTRRLAGVAAGIILAAWYLSTPARIHPDYLAYFNELVGGPKRGIEYLDDSNIEWGQQLKRLKRYLVEHNLDRVKLLYFTTGRPEYYGIRAEPIQLADLAREPEPGVYIIGAYDLVRARAYYKVDWLKRYEVMDRIGYSVYVFRVR